MRIKAAFIFTFIFLCFLNIAWSENLLDSLRAKIESSKIDKRSAIYNLYNKYVSDEIVEKYIDLTKNYLTEKEDFIYFQIQKALFLSRNNHYTRAGLMLDSCISDAQTINNDTLLAQCYFYKAAIAELTGNYKNAISNYYNALKYWELKKDTSNIVNCYNNISKLYIDFDDVISYQKAIETLTKANELLQTNKTKYRKEIIEIINNFGVAYDGVGNHHKALGYYIEYYEKALEMNNSESLLLSTLNIGDSYRILGNYSKALEFTNRCITLAEKNNNLHYLFFAKSNLAEIYNEIGKPHDALAILMEIKTELLKLNVNHLTEFYLNLLAEVYYNSGNYKESAETYKLHQQFTDSLFSSESKLKIAEFEAMFENEKKEQRILLLEKSDQLNQAQIKRQTIMRNSFIFGFILMILLAITIFKAYRTKRKDNELLNIRNHEIFQQKEEIQTQAENLELANVEITTQKEKIEQIHSELTKSIHYAKRIQQAILPDIAFFLHSETPQLANYKKNTKLPISDYFILYMPKDIVSGDFYWIAARNNWFMVAVADCTGHGVPGAFMSMLGISFLNEIIARENIVNAAQVLNELRNSLIKSLKQNNITEKSFEESIQDGMDMSFIAINYENDFKDSYGKYYEMQFAGANNSLYIARNTIVENISESQNVNNLTEIKGSKMPIGTYVTMESFVNNNVRIYQNDSIYLRSDGFEDQFGGPSSNDSGKKFKSKNLNKLLFENSNQPMVAQKKIIEKELSDWMNSNNNNYEQTDDITILGLKIN
jgi:tetratricopeptide (TPR) repeat protein